MCKDMDNCFPRRRWTLIAFESGLVRGNDDIQVVVAPCRQRVSFSPTSAHNLDVYPAYRYLTPFPHSHI